MVKELEVKWKTPAMETETQLAWERGGTGCRCGEGCVLGKGLTERANKGVGDVLAWSDLQQIVKVVNIMAKR